MSLWLFTLALGSDAAATSTGDAGLRFVDVGQGASLIAWGSGGELLAIDAGPAGASEALLDALGAGARHAAPPEVALWAFTHHDADHVGGLWRARHGMDGIAGTDDDLRLGEVWDRGEAALPDSAALRAYLQGVGDLRRHARPGDRWRRGDLTLTVLDPGPPRGGRENDRGLALCLEVAGMRTFVPGDLGAEAALEALAGCPDPDLVWAGHHGAADATSSALAVAVGDAVVVVSAGAGNRHCHPSPVALGIWSEHRLLLTGAATSRRDHPCGGLVAALGPRHRLRPGDLVFSVAGGRLVGPLAAPGAAPR